ncbi:MAG: carboxypeptidase-like regulatory domain-containing protein [Planctomycetota bacterium]
MRRFTIALVLIALLALIGKSWWKDPVDWQPIAPQGQGSTASGQTKPGEGQPNVPGAQLQGTTGTREAALAPEHEVQGLCAAEFTVLGLLDMPIPDLELTFHWAEDDFPGADPRKADSSRTPPPPARTDRAGRVVLEGLEPGNLIAYCAPGVGGGGDVQPEQRKAFTLRMELRPIPIAVFDNVGAPVVGAEIWFADPTGSGALTPAAYTAEDGQAWISSAEFGREWHIQVCHPVAGISGPVEIPSAYPPGYAFPVHLQPHPWGDVIVQLASHAGSSTEGTRITCVSAENATPVLELHAKEGHDIHFTGLTPGPYILAATLPGTGQAQTTVTVLEGAPTIAALTLSPGHHLTGLVLDETGNPVPKAEVTITRSNDDELVWATGRHFTRCGPDGRFEFRDLPPGFDRAEANEQGCTTPAQPLDWTQSAALDITLTLQCGRTLTGRVLDEQDAPYPAAFIAVTNPGNPTLWYSSTTSLPDGTFRLNNVPEKPSPCAPTPAPSAPPSPAPNSPRPPPPPPCTSPQASPPAPSPPPSAATPPTCSPPPPSTSPTATAAASNVPSSPPPTQPSPSPTSPPAPPGSPSKCQATASTTNPSKSPLTPTTTSAPSPSPPKPLSSSTGKTPPSQHSRTPPCC